MKEIINYVLEERYIYASAEINRRLDALVEDYRTAFDDVEELENDISNGLYGKIIQDKYNSLMRWAVYVQEKETKQIESEIERKTEILSKG